MTRVLHIAKDLSLPLDAVTQTFAEIGRKGAGKTYLASMIAEQMLDAEAQVVAIDPVGNWFGLRVGADGKSTGKDIFVIGGEHGDVPLTPEAGVRVAKLIVEKRISAVLDVSAFRIGERKRFAAAFGEELFHLKKTQRTPMHLFVEEAQLFIPQRVGADEARMVGAFESIIRLGRNYGIGASLITQRPQSVNKEVLSQVECLCVLQVNGSHERKALEEWVQEAGADRKLVGELPGLERGEGYVWSPSWLRIFKRVHFSKKTTFDASATPEVGRSAPAARLSAVDVEALRADLADVVAAAEKDDPRALQKRIAELQAQLQRSGGQWEAVAKEAMDELGRVKKTKATPAPKVEHVKVPMLTGAEIGRIEKSAWKIDDAATRLEALAGKLREERREILGKLEARPRPPPPASEPGTYSVPAPVPRPLVPRRAPTPPPNIDLPADGPISPVAMRMLENVARHHPSSVTRRQLAALSGYSPRKSTFRNLFSVLNARGLISKTGEDVTLSEAGITLFAGQLPSAQTPEEVRGMWKDRLPPVAWRLLEVVLERGPISRSDLAVACDYDPTKSTFRNLFSVLSANRLIVKNGEMVSAVPELIG